jgi:hypothetical protein
VELLERGMDALNRRDLEALIGLMDEEVESVSRITAVEGEFQGHAGIRRWWESWLEAFPDYDIEVVEARAVGDAVMATIRAVGHGGGSRVPVEDRFWHASRWAGGKCVWWQSFRSEAEALEAVGPPE